MMQSRESGRKTTLEQRARHFLREQSLIRGGQKLVVAVSGGADSVCLLHLLFKLQKEMDIGLHVAHLDHGLRGAESEADARYVAELSERLGVPATVEQRDVLAYKAQQRVSLEEAAREVRYTFLAQVAESTGADRVAVGHTQDDHIETILMHLIRGTGTRGLRGLQSVSQWQPSGNRLTVIRPLLTVSREETAAYCRRHRLRPRLDTSNLSSLPLRNRIRQQLLPLLQDYNPQITEALLRTAHIATADLAFLDEAAGRLWDNVAEEQGNTVILHKEKFIGLPAAMKRHLLRASIERLLGNLMDIEVRHIEEIMVALDKPAGKRLSLPGGLVFSIEYDRYLLGLDPAALCPFPVLGAESPLKIPGETLLPGWHISATISNCEQVAKEAGDFTACLDLDKTGTELTVCHYRPGDRFQPLGMSLTKKLGEFMIDAKIPRAWRQRVPIICSPGHILWVVGWRIDERVKVTDSTKQVLCLKFERC